MEKQKTVYCNELVLGSTFEDQPFVLQSIGQGNEERTYFTLSDRTGSASSVISTQLLEEYHLREKVGKVFSINAAVLVEMKLPLIVIRSLRECSKYQPAELFTGLSQERIELYQKTIRDLMQKVKNENYRALLETCLCEDNLERLATLPASLNGHGTYVGGCLAATAVVTDMALYDGVRYAKLSNQLYTTAPNWDLLITAGLLHTYGRFLFYDENDPFKKSVMGVRMNYFPILQSSLERCILEKELTLTPEEFGNLINVLQVAVSGKTSTRAVTKDGTILRCVIALYQECDIMDSSVANHIPAEGEQFFYDRKSRRYLINENEMEDM